MSKEFAIIAVSGCKRAGKNTIGDLFTDCCDDTKQVGLADAIKEFTAELLNMDMEVIEKLKVLEDTKITPFSNSGVTMRQFLQNLGQGMKEITGDNLFWCRKLAQKMEFGKNSYVITDIRFPFEEQFFRELAKIAGYDYASIKVKRSGTCGDTHTSETSIDFVYADVTVENNGTIKELAENLAEELDKFLENREVSEYSKL
jgi:hypothetical protein